MQDANIFTLCAPCQTAQTNSKAQHQLLKIQIKVLSLEKGGQNRLWQRILSKEQKWELEM